MRKPRQAPHVGEYIREQLNARSWSLADLALLMGGKDDHDISVDALSVSFILFAADVQDPSLFFGGETAQKLGRAFEVDPQTLIDIDKAWRDSPEVE